MGHWEQFRKSKQVTVDLEDMIAVGYVDVEVSIRILATLKIPYTRVDGRMYCPAWVSGLVKDSEVTKALIDDLEEASRDLSRQIQIASEMLLAGGLSVDVRKAVENFIAFSTKVREVMRCRTKQR